MFIVVKRSCCNFSCYHVLNLMVWGDYSDHFFSGRECINFCWLKTCRLDFYSVKCSCNLLIPVPPIASQGMLTSAARAPTAGWLIFTKPQRLYVTAACRRVCLFLSYSCTTISELVAINCPACRRSLANQEHLEYRRASCKFTFIYLTCLRIMYL